MADNLESFFKKHLSGESSGEDRWNVPSDSVWENALPEIQKKKGVFIPWKYLYLLGLISIVGFAISLFFWDFQKTDAPANTINTKLITNNTNQDLNTTAISDSFAGENPAKSEITGINNDTEQRKQTNNNTIELSTDNKIIEDETQFKDKKYIVGEVSKPENNAIINTNSTAQTENKNQVSSEKTIAVNDPSIKDVNGEKGEKEEAYSIVTKNDLNLKLSEDDLLNAAGSSGDSIYKQPPDNNTGKLSETVINKEYPKDKTVNINVSTDE